VIVDELVPDARKDRNGEPFVVYAEKRKVAEFKPAA
jgi:hypothetical protein